MLVILIAVVATTVRRWQLLLLLWLCRGGVSLHRLLMPEAVRDVVVLGNGGSVMRCDTQELVGWYLLQISCSSGLIVAVVVYSSGW